MFSDGNGGEYRKTLHIAPPGFAQLVESPTVLSGSPMQIDTWNREKMKIDGSSKFAPGIAPPHSLAPTTGPDAVYSGLLECKGLAAHTHFARAHVDTDTPLPLRLPS